MIEIDLPAELTMVLLLLSLVLTVYLWRHLGAYQLDLELKEKPEENYTDQTLKERYGAYIQLAGRRYN